MNESTILNETIKDKLRSIYQAMDKVSEDNERGVKKLSISFRSNKEFNRYAYYRTCYDVLICGGTDL